MRHPLPTSLALAFVAIVALAGAAGRATAGAGSSRATAAGAIVADYQRLTWTYDRIAPARRVNSTRVVKHGVVKNRVVKHRVVKHAAAKHAAVKPSSLLLLWKQRADTARRAALATLRRTVGVRLPNAPGPRASVARQRAYNERLALTLERIVPAPATATRSLASARPTPKTLAFWQLRAATAALAVARYAPRPLFTRDHLLTELLCIHNYEGKWTANTGNGYYGGLQMDLKFQRTYGSVFYERWGTADNWPVWAQVEVARRAYGAGRGFTPWPNTRRACGL